MAEQKPTRFYPKKITTAMIGLDVVTLQNYAAEHAKQKPVAVMRVYGRLTGSAPAQSQYGAYSRYTGEFEALNLIDGTTHRSRTLIVPQVAETCVDAMLASGRHDNADAAVVFGLDIGVQYYRNPNRAGTEFRFTASPAGEPGEDDISYIGAQLPALPKPPEPSTANVSAAKENSKKSK